MFILIKKRARITSLNAKGTIRTKINVLIIFLLCSENVEPVLIFFNTPRIDKDKTNLFLHLWLLDVYPS